MTAATIPDAPLEIKQLVDAHLAQTNDLHYWDVKPGDSEAGRAILGLAPDAQILMVHYLLERIQRDRKIYSESARSEKILIHLMQRSLPYSASDLERLVEGAANQTHFHAGNLGPIVRGVERFQRGSALTPKMEAELTRLHGTLHDYYAASAKVKMQLGKILGLTNLEMPDAGEPWADAALAFLKSAGAPSPAWSALFAHAMLATDSKPSAKWLAALPKLTAPIGAENVYREVAGWVSLAGPPAPPPAAPIAQSDVAAESDGSNAFLLLAQPANHALSFVIAEKNITLLKGLAWMMSKSDAPEAARGLGRLAEAGFRSAAGGGPWAPRAGNAAIWALGQMPSGAGVGELARIRPRLRDRSALKLIATAIASAAAKASLTVDELEDIAVPNGGLDASGQRRETFGDQGSATLTLNAANGHVGITWFGGDGQPRKAVPAGVKRVHAAEIKALKLAEDEVRKAIGAQASRLDRALTDERLWTLGVWRARCLNHPVLGNVARRLIWTIGGVPAFLSGDVLTTIAMAPLPALPDETVVKLWSPIDSPAVEVVRWREILAERGIVQPFKQAHREIYLLTDAERATRTYSNRFAAHILKQHQFNTLCILRGWKNSLRLMVDDCYPPATRLIPKHNLRAEFWVEGIGDDYRTDTNETGTYLRLVTDQVRFYPMDAPANMAHAGGGGYGDGYRGAPPREPLPLEQIPPHVLSEVMRDVDLFVGVASLGADPAWSDGGPNGRFRDYWREYAFGDLSATAATRKEILERLLPRLKIAGRCELSGKFLRVQGSVRAYKIHLGSGNILMEPNDQYLCIVPGRGGDAAHGLFLPFEGDQMLSIILSKAFLLWDDAKITDPTITRQIRSA